MKIGFVFNQKRSSAIEEAEFDTAEVIDSISSALNSKENEVIKVEMTKDGHWIDQLKQIRPDIIFNTAEGFSGIGREAYAPTLFEQLNFKFVGSGPYACFITLDKFLTKNIVKAKGVPTVDGHFLSSEEEILMMANELEYPVFVKPNFEGSSKGITQESKCNDGKSFIKYAKQCLKNFSQGLIVEKYIDGKDITIPYIAGLGDEGVLEPIEYVGTSKNGINIYDYEMKNHDENSIDVKCPADLDQDIKTQLKRYMKKIVSSLGINDMGRADFRISTQGEIYFIEINALPSLQQGAGIFSATALLGLDYNQTIQKILLAAINRNELQGHKKARSLKKDRPNIALVYNMKRKLPHEEGYELEAEFDSPETIYAIKKGIEDNGYVCQMVEADKDILVNLEQKSIDVVFNIAEGINKASREAQVPALCDLLEIEHTGSDAACLCLTLNKSLTSKIVGAEGILVPKSALINPKSSKIKHGLSYPIIIKPNQEGSSKGIYGDSVVHNDKELLSFIEKRFSNYGSQLLAEEYIEGREITVGLIGGPTPKVIGMSEIVFKNQDPYSVYSYELKQIDNPKDNDFFQVVSPPEINDALKRKIFKASRIVFQTTGCRDVARIDFRVAENERVYFIEINPLPGLKPNFSDLPILAQNNGMSYEKLIDSILRPALNRWRSLR